jgi:hypothetical protein
MRLCSIACFVLALSLITISCLAKDSSRTGIKVLTLDVPENVTVAGHSGPAQLILRTSKITTLTSAQENRLVEGINKLISLADKIDSETNNHKVESIELNIGVDANADAVLVNVGSNESIKVILSKK